MKRPWHAAWLSPFAAVQLIVAERFSDGVAGVLRDLSPATKHMLARSTDIPNAAIYAIFSVAENDITAWCMEGLIKARGRRQVGHFGQLAEPETLDEYWSSSRSLSIPSSSLSGVPNFKEIELQKSDVLLQIIKTAELKVALVDIPDPRAKPPIKGASDQRGTIAPTENCGTTAALISLVRIRAGKNNTKMKAAKSAIHCEWPDGIPEYLSFKDIEEKVIKWCAEHGVSAISSRTIERALSYARKPPNADK